ncbi:unnamed protein product, partial [Polarella glacialis]
PWLNAKEDPPDLPHTEVVLTAWISATCRDDFAPHVQFQFEWFSDTGAIEEAVETLPVAGWDKVGEPEILEDIAAPPPPVTDGAEAEAPPVHLQMQGFRFQQSSPMQRGDCALARYVAAQALRVRVTFPDPAFPPPALQRAATPPEAAGAKGGKDKKPAKGAEPDVEVKKVTVDIFLPLAPLLVQRRKGDTGPSIFEEMLAAVDCEGLRSLQVGVSCSGPLLSEESTKHLNPLLLTLGGVHRLPKEERLGQTKNKIYAVLESFGTRKATLASVIGPRGAARFQAHVVQFVGTWPQHELRQHLQDGRLLVEVHDRDAAPKLLRSAEDAAAAATKEERPTSSAKAKEKAPAASPKKAPSLLALVIWTLTFLSLSNVPAFSGGWAKGAVDEALAAESTHGLARFCLAELLNPRQGELDPGAEPSELGAMGRAGGQITTKKTFGKKAANPRKNGKVQKIQKLKKQIAPGSVLILLAGKFRGRRVVFLKQLESGLLLVTGPYAINGVPLRRVNQRYCIATSTKVDLKGADYKSITDQYFAREDKKAGKKDKSEGAFFSTDKAKTSISQEKKDGQKKLEDGIAKGLSSGLSAGGAELKSYLKARFSLTANMYPHELKFCKKKMRRGVGGKGPKLQVSELFGENARELLSSTETAVYEFLPGFLETGAWVGLTATLSLPLQPVSTPRATVPEVEARELVPVPPQTERYERFARMVIVVDYKRTTVVKKLLAAVNSNNVGAMNLESGQARALAAVELTEKQKDDQNLDILTGFIVMDRNTRIIVVEGLRDGAMKKVVEVVGTVSTKKLKVLFNQELGFSKRLYTDFNLVLKQAP